MSEKYFEYLLFLLIGASILSMLIWRWYIRLRFLQNIVRINILKRQQKSNQNLFFSTAILNRCTVILYLNRKQISRRALRALVGGNTEPAVDFLQTKFPQLAALLFAHSDTISAYRQIKKHKIISPSDRKYGVFIPILAYLTNDRRTLLSAVGKFNLRSKHHNALTTAYYNAVSSHVYLYEGDMLSASQNASAALKFFQKRRYAIETAACHLILAQIYRISCVNDIAFTMIESAIKIYQTQKTPLFLARAVTAKGMLMVFENRYEEAAEEYDKALKLPITQQLYADILNQKVLLFLAQNNLKTAQKLIAEAADIQHKLKNPYGNALSLQLSAHVQFQKKQYRKAAETAQKAFNLYAKHNNYSAAAECLYLKADAQYRMKYFKTAEKNLRLILQINRSHPNNFHTANAYSLLGLIYMQKKDLQRAKVLFQQSLHLEQSHQRCEGLAADYANLALIDELSDYKENAASNWQIAAEYAQQTGDTDLVTLIEKLKTDR